MRRWSYDVGAGADASAHWDVRGPVSFVAGDPPILDFGAMNGRVTVRALGQSRTTDNKTEPFTVILIPGKFCT